MKVCKPSSCRDANHDWEGSQHWGKEESQSPRQLACRPWLPEAGEDSTPAGCCWGASRSPLCLQHESEHSGNLFCARPPSTESYVWPEGKVNLVELCKFWTLKNSAKVLSRQHKAQLLASSCSPKSQPIKSHASSLWLYLFAVFLVCRKSNSYIGRA